MMTEKTKNLIIISVFVLAASLLYIFRLDTISSGFHGDEAELTLFSLKILRGAVEKIIGVGRHNHPILSFLPQVLTMKIFGANIFGARLASALIGIVTVPLFYFFVRENWGRRTALLAAILFTASHWTIAINRLAINNNQTMLATVLAFWSVLRAFKSKKVFHFSLAGALTGLSIYLYAGARIVPIVIFSLLIYQSVKEKENIRQYIRNVILFTICAAVIVAPQGFFFLKNRGSFTSRFDSIYIFSPGSSYWTKNNYPNASPLEILVAQTKKTFNLSTDGGDTGGQYGYRGRVVDLLTLAGALIGAALMLATITKIKSFLLFFWLAIPFTFGEILMVDPFFFPRAVPALPAFFILVGLGIKLLWQKLETFLPIKLKFLSLAIWLFVFPAIYQNLHVYFVRSEQEAFGDPNKYTATKIGQYLGSLDRCFRAIFLTAPNMHADFAPIRFLAPKVRFIDIDHPAHYQAEKLTQKTAFVVGPEYSEKLKEIISLNPEGQLITEHNKNQRVQFYLYQISP